MRLKRVPPANVRRRVWPLRRTAPRLPIAFWDWPAFCNRGEIRRTKLNRFRIRAEQTPEPISLSALCFFADRRSRHAAQSPVGVAGKKIRKPTTREIQARDAANSSEPAEMPTESPCCANKRRRAKEQVDPRRHWLGLSMLVPPTHVCLPALRDVNAQHKSPPGPAEVWTPAPGHDVAIQCRKNAGVQGTKKPGRRFRCRAQFHVSHFANTAIDAGVQE